MSEDTRERIMTAARATVQAHGYNGLSFRDLAREIGIKSASVHYHFPTKGDLGAELARRYSENAQTKLDAISASTPDPAACLQRYAAIFRQALEKNNRMCLCGILAAEYDELPDAVRTEVRAFGDVNIAWLAMVLGRVDEPRDAEATRQWAVSLFAAISGAQLVARSRNDLALYDAVVKSYRVSGLIPAESRLQAN